jgi:hypothetical protein
MPSPERHNQTWHAQRGRLARRSKAIQAGITAASGRVAPGGCPPGAPMDPDVRDYRIRLFDVCVRYEMYECTMRGLGSGSRSSSAAIRVQLIE